MSASTVYSILSKKENAHEDAIYCGVWPKISETGESRDTIKDYIVTGGLDGVIKVWTVENNKLELCHTLKGHNMAVISIAISPDRYTIASASLDSRIMIWELPTGIAVHEIKANPVDVWQLVFSPRGIRIATGGIAGNVIICDVAQGTVTETHDTKGKSITSVAWSRNDKHLAIGSDEGQVYIIDVGKKLHNNFSIDAHKESVRDLAFSPSCKLLATASKDGTVKVYIVESATLQNTLQHNSWVMSVCFSHDGTRVATAAADGRVRVADVADLNVLHSFHEHTDSVCSVKFNSISNKLMSVSKDKSINIYECPIPPKPVKK